MRRLPPSSPPYSESRVCTETRAALKRGLVAVFAATALLAAGCSGPSARPSPNHGGARYASVAILLAAMSEHGDTCVVSQHPGLNLIVCKGETVAQTFSSAQNTPAGIVTLAHTVLRHDAATGKTEAAVAGPDWLVVGPPAFVSRVQHGLGGRYISSAA
jgi:hypothetical protein